MEMALKRIEFKKQFFNLEQHSLKNLRAPLKISNKYTNKIKYFHGAQYSSNVSLKFFFLLKTIFYFKHF